MAKEGETFFFYLTTCLVNLSTRLFPSSTCLLVTRLLVYSSTCPLSTRQPYPIQLELCKKIYKVL